MAESSNVIPLYTVCVCPSELAQHQHGVLPVDWLSENLAAKGDGGVGSEDQLAISPWQQSLRLGTREPQDHIESGL